MGRVVPIESDVIPSSCRVTKGRVVGVHVDLAGCRCQIDCVSDRLACLRATKQCLGRNTRHVGAFAANAAGLDQRDAATRIRHVARDVVPARASAEHNYVEGPHVVDRLATDPSARRRMRVGKMLVPKPIRSPLSLRRCSLWCYPEDAAAQPGRSSRRPSAASADAALPGVVLFLGPRRIGSDGIPPV